MRLKRGSTIVGVLIIVSSIALYILQCLFLFKLNILDVIRIVSLILFISAILFMGYCIVLCINYYSPSQKKIRKEFKLFFDSIKDNFVEFQRYCIAIMNKNNIDLLFFYFHSYMSYEDVEKKYYENDESSFLKLCKNIERENRSAYRGKVKSIFNKKDLPKFYGYIKDYERGYLVDYDYSSLILSIISFIISLSSYVKFPLKPTLHIIYIPIVIVVLGILFCYVDFLRKSFKTKNVDITKCDAYNELVDTYKAFCGEEVEKKILYWYKR